MSGDLGDLGGARVVDVRVLLPQDWWRIPLQPPQARERSVDRLVQRQFAGIDNQPQLRAETRRELLRQAEAVADVDGRLLALSLQQVQGVPVPASLTLHWITMPTDPATMPADGELLRDLQLELQPAAGAEPGPGFSLDIARVPAGTVLRRVYTGTMDREGIEPAPSLVADYWVERPDGTGLAYLTFASPLLALRDTLLELFDSIVSVVRWVRTDEYATAQPYGHAARNRKQTR